MSKELNKIFTQRVDIKNGWLKTIFFNKRKSKENFRSTKQDNNRKWFWKFEEEKMVQRTLFNF